VTGRNKPVPLDAPSPPCPLRRERGAFRGVHCIRSVRAAEYQLAQAARIRSMAAGRSATAGRGRHLGGHERLLLGAVAGRDEDAADAGGPPRLQVPQGIAHQPRGRQVQPQIRAACRIMPGPACGRDRRPPGDGAEIACVDPPAVPLDFRNDPAVQLPGVASSRKPRPTAAWFETMTTARGEFARRASASSAPAINSTSAQSFKKSGRFSMSTRRDRGKRGAHRQALTIFSRPWPTALAALRLSTTSAVHDELVVVGRMVGGDQDAVLGGQYSGTSGQLVMSGRPIVSHGGRRGMYGSL